MNLCTFTLFNNFKFVRTVVVLLEPGCSFGYFFENRDYEP